MKGSSNKVQDLFCILDDRVPVSQKSFEIILMHAPGPQSQQLKLSPQNHSTFYPKIVILPRDKKTIITIIIIIIIDKVAG